MVSRDYFARRFLALKLLRGCLVASAFYDAGAALVLVAAPAQAARLFGQRSLEGPAFLWSAASWLTMLAVLAVAAAGDVRRHSAVIAVVLGGRGAAILILGIAAPLTGVGSPPVWLPAVNGLLAAGLASSWWQLRR